MAFRHGHKFNFGCSDIYIIVALTPVDKEIKFDQKEISNCQWMPIQVESHYLKTTLLSCLLQEYATSPLVHDTNRHFAEKYIECDKKGVFIGLKEIQLKIQQATWDQKVFSVNFDDKE